MTAWERMDGFLNVAEVGGIVEMNSHVLFMEWAKVNVTAEQRHLLRKITDPILIREFPHDRKVRSILLIGDSQSLTPSYIELYQLGACAQSIPKADKRLFAQILKDWKLIAAGEITSWPIY
ncbi:MAG: hypothetical protein L0Y56_03300 [Nitrospira sp.]|nr:hypothetical protein [Nitrospira sp.]